MKVHKYSRCKKGTFKIIFLHDVFPVKIVFKDTSLLGCFAMSTGKCNHQSDEGDSALLWNVRNYQLTWYYIPEDWNNFRHDYENCISRKLVLALIFMSELVIFHKWIKEIFLKNNFCTCFQNYCCDTIFCVYKNYHMNCP